MPHEFLNRGDKKIFAAIEIVPGLGFPAHLLSLSKTILKRSSPAFLVANADGFVHFVEKNLAIADLAA